MIKKIKSICDLNQSRRYCCAISGMLILDEALYKFHDGLIRDALSSLINP